MKIITKSCLKNFKKYEPRDKSGLKAFKINQRTYSDLMKSIKETFCGGFENLLFTLIKSYIMA